MPDINVDHVLPEVIEENKRWVRVRDCIAGQDAIKKRAPSYLPMIMPWDTTAENMTRNVAYTDRAVFYGVTKRTLKGMVGQVTAKPAVLTVPELLDFVQDDIDGGAVSIDQQAKKTLSDVLAVGRCGLLADYPNIEPGASVTRADLIERRIRPSVQFYFAEKIINWRVAMVKGQRKLTLVVLVEEYIKEDDGFKKEMASQWRVLRLVNEQYFVQVWRKNESGAFVVVESYMPRDASGKAFDEILFIMVGSDNNDPGIDDAPLSDMAELNIAHYRNSADHEESAFMVGQPTPWASGLTKEWVEDVWKNGVALGSRTAIPLPVDAAMGLLQAEENNLCFEAMKHKEEQMKALGAKLVEPKIGNRTLGEAQMDEASEASVLMTCATNVSTAYTKALRWCAKFVGIEIPDDSEEEEFGYQLNTDFEIARMTVEQRGQLLKEWQAGAISFTEYRSILRRANIATQTDEEAQAEVDAQTQKDMEDQASLMDADAQARGLQDTE